MTIKQKKTIAIAATGGTIAGTWRSGKDGSLSCGRDECGVDSGDNPDDSECCRY